MPLFFATGLHPLWPLVWLAPISVLISAFSSSAATAAIVAFPAAWTSYEFLLSLISPHGTFGSLAYTQMDFLSMIQIAALAGLWGITFLVMLVPAGIAVVWHYCQNGRQAKPALIIPIVLCVATLGFGWIRLAQPAAPPSLRVGLAVTDTTIRYFETEQAQEALPVVQDYARRIREAASQGAEVVVLPEKFVGVTPSYASEVKAIFAETARENNVTIVTGLNQIAPEAKRNIASVFSRQGQIFAEYDNRHLVPEWEAGYRRGESPKFFTTALGQWGVAICKDMDFPELGRQYAKEGVGLMLIPAWDFGRDAWLHARMAILRGVEGGYAVVRCAQEGLLTVSDHYGRVLAEKSSSSANETPAIAT